MAVSGRPAGRSYLVPIVALGSTLVALVVAIGVVLVLRGDATSSHDGFPAPDGSPTSGPAAGDRTSAGDTSSTGPPTGPAAEGAECLVGTWRVTEHREQVDVPDVGRLSFTGGAGTRLSLSAGGTAITDYGTGTSYRAGYAGQDVILELRGRVNFRYAATGDRFELLDLRSDAEFRLSVGDRPASGWQPFTASTAPSGYTCVGDSLTQRSLVATTLYTRTD
ncbi:hypothetical protein [Plantactinospora sp. B5E13]|uniref:hypothetical protein n=1 Tax=Plantactinospora sp. B5E13 TaxID=3153758 RepID=UPI00325E2337